MAPCLRRIPYRKNDGMTTGEAIRMVFLKNTCMAQECPEKWVAPKMEIALRMAIVRDVVLGW